MVDWIDISGSLTKTFGFREDVRDKNDRRSYRAFKEISEELIGKPINRNDKCIGYIKKVDVEENKWYGKLYACGVAEFSIFGCKVDCIAIVER